MKAFYILIFFTVFVSKANAKAMQAACEMFKVPTEYADILRFAAKGELSPLCVEYSLRRWLGSRRGPQNFIARCPEGQNHPTRGGLPPCQSAEYVAFIHKTFSLVTDCFEINPRHLAAKIKGESGFIHNAMGPGGDAGIGQLTFEALVDLNELVPSYQQLIQQSKKPSCQIIVKHWDVIRQGWSAEMPSRCSLMKWPENPFRNMVLTAMYYKHLEKLTEQEMQTYQVASLLRSLKFDLQELAPLTQVLANLAYNSGSRGAVLLLRDYLLQRQKSQKPFVSKEDFNFKRDLSWIHKVANPKTISVTQLTFPGYVKIHLRTGHPGYLPDLMKQIYDYNENLAVPHLCTPKFIEGYLAL